MNVNFFLGKTNLDSFKCLIEKLKSRNLNENHIILTPDRNALNVEESVFDILKEESISDISVLTFSRFASILINEKSRNVSKILSKSACVAIIKNILMSEKNNLKYFSGSINFTGFCSELYETICMFKSCNVKPNDIIETNNVFLNKKLSDIKIVYEKFEDYLKSEYTDSFNRLVFCSKLIDENFKNTNFYFVEFEDLNFQMYQIITQLIKKSKSVNFAIVSNSFADLKNKHIFVNSIYYNVADICKQLGVYYNEFKCEYDSMDLKNYLCSYNLIKNSTIKSDVAYTLYDFDNKYQEVNFLILKLKKLFSGKKIKSFSDIAVCCSDINKYKVIIEDAFNNSGIPFYMDISKTIKDHFVVRFISDLLKVFTWNFDLSVIISLIKSPLINLEGACCYQKFVEDYGVRFDALIDKNKLNSKIEIDDTVKSVYSFLELLLDCKKEIAKGEGVGAIVELLSKLLKEIKIDERVAEMANAFLEEKSVLELRDLKIVYSKLSQVFEELCDVFKNSQMTINEFEGIFKAYIEDIKMSQPPIGLASVFVGNLGSSYFNECKYLFVLGANEGEFPVFSNDLGIILDKEISQLHEKNKISPTISLVNKRKKFKCYELLFLADKEVFISYISSSDKGELLYPCDVVRNLKDLGILKTENGKGYFDSSKMLIKNSSDEIEFLNKDLFLAKVNFINALKNYEVFNENVYYRNYLNFLYSILKNKNADNLVENSRYKNEINKIAGGEYLFKNNHVSVSQFECFFKCPYMHFVKYGLKLNDREKLSFDSRVYGTIIHEFLALGVKELATKINNENLDIKECATRNFYVILNAPKYSFIINNQLNRNHILALEDECFRILKNIHYQFKNSGFLPLKNGYETSFSNFKNKLTIEVGDKVFELSGVIDRIDECNDWFRVLDYKTGSDLFNDFTDLFYGKKIQLIVYLNVYMKNTNKKPAGAFYMPIRNVFSADDSAKYALSGIMENSLENIYNMDLNLKNPSYASKIVDLKTKKDGQLSKNSTSQNLLLTSEQFEYLTNFASDLMKLAIKNVCGGEIAPLPLEKDNKKVCSFCEYKGICCFDETLGNFSKKVEKIENIEAMKKMQKIIDEDK